MPPTPQYWRLRAEQLKIPRLAAGAIAVRRGELPPIAVTQETLDRQRVLPPTGDVEKGGGGK